MKLQKLAFIFLFTLGSTSLFAQKVEKQYFVPKAGTLISMLTEEESNKITHLTLTGKINAEDFKHIRNGFNKLEVLDLSNADIKMYTGKNGTHPNGIYVYMHNFIPAYAFCKSENGQLVGKKSLKKIILSEKIKNIEDAAFQGCDNLYICEIHKKGVPNLLPQALNDSLTAIFVPLGSSDSYKRNEKWKNFTFMEGSPIEVSIQTTRMNTLEEKLLSKGVQPHDINYLTIEGKLGEADFKLIRNYMPNLVGVNLSNCTATAIPAFTFSQKKYLMSIRLPKNLEVIGDRAFSNCIHLRQDIILPASVTAIEHGAFMGCGRLKSIIATGNKISTLGEKALDKAQLVYKQ